MKAKNEIELRFLIQEVKLQVNNSSVAWHPNCLSPKIMSVNSCLILQMKIP